MQLWQHVNMKLLLILSKMQEEIKFKTEKIMKKT